MRSSHRSATATAKPSARRLRRGALLLECLVALVLTSATAGLLLLLADTMRALHDERQQLLRIRDAQGEAFAPLRSTPCTPPAPFTLSLTPRSAVEVQPRPDGEGGVVWARWWRAHARDAHSSPVHTAVSSTAAWCVR